MNAIDPVELIRRLERARDVADDLLVTSTGSASVKWRAKMVAFEEAIRLVRDAKWWAYTPEEEAAK